MSLLHVDQIEIFAGTKKLAVHERLFGNNKWSLNPDHYLELIQQRPMSKQRLHSLWKRISAPVMEYFIF